MTLQQKRFFCFLLALVGGFVLWEHAPHWLARQSPWNLYGWHFLAGMAALGLVVRGLTMGKPDLIYSAVVAGQWFAILWPSMAVGNLLSIHTVMVLVTSLAAYFGAWAMMHFR